MLHGKCLCGAVEIEVADEFEYAGYCHCQGCRAVTGSAFSAFAGIPKDKVRITKGSAKVSVNQRNPDNRGFFCGDCRSGLYALVRQGQYAHVAMGVLRDDPKIRPQFHIMVEFKAPWHQIADALPQFAGFPPPRR